MFTRYVIVVICLALPLGAAAQSLNISAQGTASGNDVPAFILAEGPVSFGNTRVSFSSGTVIRDFLDYGVSPDLSVVGFLSAAGGNIALVMDSEGDTLAAFPVEKFSPDDPSVAIYPAGTGAALVRSNIAGFSFYNSFGQIITRVSSSSQSKGGEAISEVAMDPLAQTIVIYNPQIKRDGRLGSQAQILNASNRLEHIYSNPGRIIKDVVVSDNGQFIILLTAGSGSDDEVVIMDRFGNELNVIRTAEDIKDARLSESAEYITLLSTQRVLAFDVLKGERLGSTSLRSPLIAAQYFPEDEIILAMTGNSSPSTGAASNIEFHAIHLGKRQIARKGLGSPIRFNKAIRHDLVRTGKNRYRLEGANRQIEIRASF